MINSFAKLVGRRSRTSRMVFGLAGCVLALVAGRVIEANAKVATDLRAELIAESPMFEYLAANFDAEFDVMIADIESSIAVGIDPRLAAATAMEEFRIGHAGDISAADDQTQRALIEAMVDIHEAVLVQEGPKVCALFLSYGYAAFNGSPLEKKYEDLQLAQVLQTLAAAKSGSENPVSRGAISETDNEVVGDAMVTLGADEAQLQAIVSGTTKAAALCDGMLTFMRAMNTDGDTAGARVRAEFLKEVAGA